jgi:hypothetical protein
MATRSPEAENEKFGVDAALNKKGFAEFLAKHPDAATFDVVDEGELEKRFEAFEKSTKLAEELKVLYRDQIEKEMDIKLDQKDLASVDVYIEELAIRDQGELERLFNRLYYFKKLPEEIEGLEKELTDLTKNGDADTLSALEGTLEGDVDKFKAAKGYLGGIGQIKLYYHTVARYLTKTLSDKDYEGVKELDVKKEAASHLKGKYKDELAKVGAREVENNLRRQLADIDITLGTISTIERRKTSATETFDNLRMKIFGEIGEITDLKKAIERKAKEELEGLLAKTDVKSLERAAQRHKKLSEVKDNTETGVDPLKDLKPNDYKDKAETKLREKISDDVLERVNKAKLGSDALRNLEKSLEDMLNRTEVGTKKGAEARSFIIDRLDEVAINLGLKNDAESHAKRLIVNRIIIKLQKVK